MTSVDPERRAFLRTSAGVAALSALTVASAQAQTSEAPAKATNTVYTMKPLPFDPQKIKGMS